MSGADAFRSGCPAVLVVDDNRANVLATEAALASLGVRIVRAHSGREALKILLDQDFAVILLDVRMPGLGGLETARLIRERKRFEHTPIMFVTAHGSDDGEVLAAYKLGAVDFLFKPVLPEVLRAKISAFVELQKRTCELADQAQRLRAHEQRALGEAMVDERRRWQEEALQHQLEALSEIDRRKDEFLAILGHELRNPLSAIVLGHQLLHRFSPEDTSPDAHRVRLQIERSVRHLVRLVDDLLDLSRISSGRIELRKASTPLSYIIESAVDISRPVIEQRKHRLVVELPSDPIVLRVDPVRISQAVSNLLNNAALYTACGGTIRLGCSKHGDQVEIEVCDNGRGISPELLPRVFDSFVQEERGGRGLGLGLTVVKRMVEMHGGRVSVQSEGSGKGSQFTIQLPFDPADSSQPADRLEVPKLASAKPLSVALVEDNEDVRETTQELLRLLGHRVEVAADGQEGVELILRMRPDVALIDMGLPMVGGAEVAIRVRHELGGAVKLVAMTGMALEVDRRRAREAGFDAYLVKPADIEALIEALATSDA